MNIKDLGQLVSLMTKLPSMDKIKEEAERMQQLRRDPLHRRDGQPSHVHRCRSHGSRTAHRRTRLAHRTSR